ncbi:MAG: acyltransferase [Hungatella sp.]|jgi:surface polysaccharide O-acyltransferase-like enzyme|nr:acyltransferase [Hungatella sp.]
MRNKRDISVELARILASMIVIGVHSCLSVYYDGACAQNRVFIACLFADGVAVFWLIMGGFLFKNTCYKALIQRTLISTAIPMVCFSIVIFYLSGWILEGKTILQSIIHTKEEYIAILNNLLAWDNPIPYLGHLWYLYVYFIIILIWPVLKSFVNYLDGSVERTKYFLFISFIYLVINDISDNRLAVFSHHSINAAVPAAIEVIWGHILYKNKARFSKMNVFIYSIICFIVLNVFRTKVQFERYSIGQGNHILYWYTCIGLICAICLLVCCFGLVRKIKCNGTKVISFLAEHTFNVYLIHPLVITKMQCYSIQDNLYRYIVGNNKTDMGEYIYTLILVILIFGISIGLSCTFKYFVKILRLLRTSLNKKDNIAYNDCGK